MPRLACCLIIAIALLLFAPVQVRAELTEAELDEGWIELFDGETLFGWKPAAKANWKVVDGTIVVDSGEVGLLCTTTPFSNYVLKVEFRAPKSTNSGIFLHTIAQPKDPTTDCLELNIAGEGVSPFTTGSLVGRKKTEKIHESADWQAFEVTLDGDKCEIKLDGELVLSYVDPKPLQRGLIGLQHNMGKVEFRNIKLKPLGLKSIFNGKDFTSWNTPKDSESKFTVNEAGEMNVRGGSGYLESQGKYGDFVLQLECIAHAKNLNSGVFFRCIPGEKMNGYESQIHNGTIGGDRTKPMDCGTGGIFRRQNARRVVADDLAWFHKTIIADGPHMAVWVNGYQVSDWTDDRKPHANPRNGLRTAAGTLQIQGHDPTTNLSFRGFHIAETAGE